MNIQKDNKYYRIDVDKFLIARILYIKITNFDKTRNRYSYETISSEVDRRFEIPETEEERLLKKYNRFHLDDRKSGGAVSGGASYEEGDLLGSVTEEDILKKIEERREQNERALESSLRCPITGGRLISLGSDLNVMDGPATWVVEGHEDVKWYVDPRRHKVFQGQGCYTWYGEKKEWVEQIEICDGWKFVDKPKTPEEEAAVQKIIHDYEEKKRNDKEEYERKVASREITPTPSLNIKRVFAKTVDMDVVEVRPLSPPSNFLFYVDYKYNTDSDES